jgi:hypothetical protein
MAGTRRILTTLYYPQRPAWVAVAEMIDPGTKSLAARVRELLRRAPGHDAVILNGADRGDQLAAIVLRRLRPSVPIVITDCQWKLEAGFGERAATRLGIRLLDGPRTCYCVASTDEQSRFPRSWGVAPERVFVTHWYVGLSDAEASAAVTDGGYVFAGGDSMRDYGPLLEAARRGSFEVRVATHLDPPVADLPANVRFGPMTPEEYVTAMCGASVVAVCLAADTERSAGQSNYLNARALGKLVVVNDTTGVRDYVEDGQTGVLVPSGDPQALAEALEWALDPSNSAEVRRIAENGKRVVGERFRPQDYVERLLEIVESVAPRS